MRVDLFDFDLPEERIALRPARPRDAARMLVVRPPDGLDDRGVRDLPELLRPGDILVVNDTRVIHAELHGTRDRDGSSVAVSVTLIRRTGPNSWDSLARPAKRLRADDRIHFGEGRENVCLVGTLDATVTANDGSGVVSLAFDMVDAALDEAIAAAGHVPLPPYIAGRRAEDASDDADYQTMFARAEGAVAAPTAGLHFTPELLERLRERGVGVATVTLHVGPGTFLPVKTDDTTTHRMHAEWGEVNAATAARLNAARAAGARIVAVGTTSLRLLESATEADGTIRSFAAATNIFITPGYRFRAVDVLMTNFHLPRSTLFMLVSAFSGRETMLSAYRHAIASGYRFYSYGDASLLFPAIGGTDD
ncbi:MAG: tRNA preQ1(34) S-adenosylmethionine ribosyltransferase-isomerase QueA [Bauldia sp.]|nr:tRNA preQ1(34) S-adenosylmethionine ribosyltransferase-isomerase QueA [Bauldia sp.]